MRIDHVVPAINEEASGPSYTVPRLCASLGALGYDVTLHTLTPAPAPVGPYHVHAYPRLQILKRLGISPEMKRGLRNAARETSVLHSHMLWMMPNIYPGQVLNGA